MVAPCILLQRKQLGTVGCMYECGVFAVGQFQEMHQFAHYSYGVEVVHVGLIYRRVFLAEYCHCAIALLGLLQSLYGSASPYRHWRHCAGEEN